MLSSVLRTPRAVRVNVEIMRAFVQLRRLLQSNAELAKRLDELEQKYDGQLRVVFDAIRELIAPPIDAETPIDQALRDVKRIEKTRKAAKPESPPPKRPTKR